jgi:hypothetical protein
MEMASQAVQLERTEITLESRDETPAITDVSKTISGEMDENRIAALAYELWQERGCPIGSPNEDWFRAKEKLKYH